ncbi:hypothetical protein NC652_029900 [Populus alba x Populus x berolinensis]|nr:hypothetical protein NC652_029900 [Populus alba x Populus x berolinensis]
MAGARGISGPATARPKGAVGTIGVRPRRIVGPASGWTRRGCGSCLCSTQNPIGSYWVQDKVA